MNSIKNIWDLWDIEEIFSLTEKFRGISLLYTVKVRKLKHKIQNY